ncbi:MAG: hypothetical protein ACYCUG_02300 [Acidimicrobiales bacterium]
MCQEQHQAAALSGEPSTSPQTLDTAGLSGGAAALLKEINGGSLACPTR